MPNASKHIDLHVKLKPFSGDYAPDPFREGYTNNLTGGNGPQQLSNCMLKFFFSACQMDKNTDLHVKVELNSKLFSWELCLRHPSREGTPII